MEDFYISKNDRGKDLSGHVFGNYQVIGDTGKRTKQNGKIYLVKRLDNGEYEEIQSINLVRGLATGYRRSEDGRQKSKNSMNELNKNREAYLKKRGYQDGTTTWAKNIKTPTTNTSGHKGVSWDKRRKKWRAYIFYKGKQIHLGVFQNIEEAIEARKAAELKYFN